MRPFNEKTTIIGDVGGECVSYGNQKFGTCSGVSQLPCFVCVCVCALSR